MKNNKCTWTKVSKIVFEVFSTDFNAGLSFSAWNSEYFKHISDFLGSYFNSCNQLLTTVRGGVINHIIYPHKKKSTHSRFSDRAAKAPDHHVWSTVGQIWRVHGYECYNWNGQMPHQVETTLSVASMQKSVHHPKICGNTCCIKIKYLLPVRRKGNR